MPQKKKLSKRSKFSFLKKPKVLIVLLFVIAVAGVGVHKLSSSSAATACIGRTFTRGATGPCVADIQGLFNYHVLLGDAPRGTKTIKVDGIWGGETSNAILVFQVYNRVKPVYYGQVSYGYGNPTWEHLCSFALSPPSNLQWAKVYAIHAGCVPITN